MFGHRDDDDDKKTPEDSVPAIDETVHPDHDSGNYESEAHVPDTGESSNADQPGTMPSDVTDDAPAASPNLEWQHPGPPLDAPTPEQINDIISPAGGFPKRPTYQYPQGMPQSAGDEDEAPKPVDKPTDPDLVEVKEHALEELQPLLDKLDLPPEERFRAIMMILQAKDDKSMLKAAYQAAHAIEDEETRARALYAIVNEVDYFSQNDTDRPAD